MRILQLTETLHAGGAETFVVRLSNALVEAGHEVTVAVAVPIVNSAVREALDPRIAVEILPARNWRWWSKAESGLRRAGIRFRPLHWRQRRWLQRIVWERRPDVIHSHLLKADLLAADVRTDDPEIGHVMTVHGDYGMYLSGLADPFLPKLRKHIAKIARTADAIVGVAADHLDFFGLRFNVKSKRLHLIYNGYAKMPPAKRLKSALGLPEDKFIFGMVARGIKEKGWAEAVAAFTELARSDTALVLVGDGPFLNDLRDTVKHSNVHFMGFSPNPAEMIHHFDVGILPSYFAAESLPTAIIEYLACGKPVIATDVGEVAAMLGTGADELAGIVLEIGDDLPAKLAAAMRVMIDEPNRKQAFADHAPLAFAKFDMKRCVELYETLFRAINSSNNSRH